jgi:sugar lactone lactonase YvrE
VKRISWTITAALVASLFLPINAAQALSAGQLTCVKSQVIFSGRIAVATDSQGNIYTAESDGHLVRKVDAMTGDATIIAGTGESGFSGDGELAINAKLNKPQGVAVMGTVLYIADYRNDRIRKVNLETGNISTFGETIYSPISIAVNGGIVYAQSENGEIFKFAQDGTRTLFISNGGDPGWSMAFDSDGNLYTLAIGPWWEENKRAYKTTPGGVKTSFAGTGVGGYTGDGGLATAAQFQSLNGIAIDSSNNVYISDLSAEVIRKVNASDGKISTFVTGVKAVTMALVNSGTLIFGEEGAETYSVPVTPKIKSINLQTKVVSNLTGGSPFLFGYYAAASGNGGLAKNANLGSGIVGFYTDPATKDIYLSSYANGTISKIDGTTGIISTFAGSTDQSLQRNVNVVATQTRLSGNADQVVKGPDGNIYFGDRDVVKRVDKTTKIITIVAGGGTENIEGGLATNAALARIRGVAFDSLGNLYVAEMPEDHLVVARIRKINANGQIFTIAGTTTPGNAGLGYSGDGGPASAAKLQAPNAMAIDSQDNLYFAESDGNVIRKINLSASTPTIALVAGKGSNSGLAFTGLATQAAVNRPAYDANLVLGPDGNLYWSEGFFGGGSAIRSVDLSSGPNAGKISTVLLNTNGAINFDAQGNLLVIEKGSIFKFDKANNTISINTGSPGTTNIGGSSVPSFKPGCNIVPQAAISVGSTPNSQVAAIPSGATQAMIPATAALPAITLNFGGTAPTAVTVAPVASNPAAPASTPFKILGSTKIVDITPTGTFNGSATVCLDGLSTDSIFHFTGGQWVELPGKTYANGQVCGVTTSFSPFAAAEPQAIVAPVVSAPVVSAPGAPASVVATATGKRSATVAFTAPASNGGSVITSYTATSTPGGVTKTLTQAGSGTFTIDGLQPGTSYTFAVTAKNANGTSAATTSNSIKTTAADVASLTSITFTDDGSGTAGKLAWVGKNIDAVLYTGPATSYPGAFTFGAFSSSWNGSIRNLTPETSYTVSIYAISADGLGESKSFTFKTGVKTDVVKNLAYWNTWLTDNTYSKGEAARLYGLLNKFNSLETSPIRSFIKVPVSLASTVSATSLTPKACSLVSTTAKVDAGMVKALTKDTCTISYTVSGPSKAPATLVKDFVFKKVG